MSTVLPRRLMRAGIAMVGVAGLAMGLSACSGTSAEGGSAGKGDENLTLQFRGTPISLDPAFQGTASGSVFTVLAYDPLIYQAADGSLQPSLATEWEFTDESYTTFELTLRDDVEFASGEPFTAESVKNSVEYFLDADAANAARVGEIEDVEVVDPTTVRFHYADPFSGAPFSMTQTVMMGNIIGPDGLSDPDSLLLEMDGAGQYTYNSAESVPESSYVYDRNDNYWNPDAQMWDRITVDVIGDPNAVLNAASTGQIDFGLGSALLAGSAEDAGLDVLTAPFYNWELRLLDMAGEVNPALADERVRHAIALAVDRESIVNALGGDYMSVSDQMVAPGVDGHDDSLGWDHDPDAARDLLAEAGYPDGFEMTIVDSSQQDYESRIAQAVASSLGEVGIDVTIEVDAVSIPSFNEKLESGEFEASLWASNGTVGNTYQSFRFQDGASNPFGFSDDTMEALYEQSLVVDGEERTEVYQQMNERWQELAYTVPILTEHYVNYAGPRVTNIKSSAANPVMLPVGPRPEDNWQPTGE
ncbi:ABC transporter substrate-binding protein [Microbacterium sp. G2-8]|uniref:ABC transporter substrate-binding protein n=1 Tax=Microbacterium sp. G2-8 TaxID=2842454 RepID=UPI001C89FC2B|nr:ABC transporter substrate-binding protein [Microbacterium sp. G2-8]